jgi:hypothetical protein
MAISVLISRGEQYIANAHTWMCGLVFKRSMECVALKRIKTALNLRTLFGAKHDRLQSKRSLRSAIHG